MLLKLQFSASFVNTVVGKNGSNLERFLTEFNCHVYAPNLGGHHNSAVDGFLYVEGVADSIVRCIEDLLNLLSPYPLDKKTSTDLSFISLLFYCCCYALLCFVMQ